MPLSPFEGHFRTGRVPTYDELANIGASDDPIGALRFRPQNRRAANYLRGLHLYEQAGGDVRFGGAIGSRRTVLAGDVGNQRFERLRKLLAEQGRS